MLIVVKQVSLMLPFFSNIQSATLTAIAPIENYHGFYGCGPENSHKHIKTVFLPVTTGETMVKFYGGFYHHTTGETMV